MHDTWVTKLVTSYRYTRLLVFIR